jgi:hypothetical protein
VEPRGGGAPSRPLSGRTLLDVHPPGPVVRDGVGSEETGRVRDACRRLLSPTNCSSPQRHRSLHSSWYAQAGRVDAFVLGAFPCVRRCSL